MKFKISALALFVGMSCGANATIECAANDKGGVNCDVTGTLTADFKDAKNSNNEVNANGVEGAFAIFGSSTGATVSNNILNVTSSNIKAATGGNASKNGAVFDNIVTVKDSILIGGGITGGKTSGTGEAYKNRVEVLGHSKIEKDVVGSQTDTGANYSNTIIISDDVNISGSVFGNNINNTNVSENVSGNTIKISGNANVAKDVHASYFKLPGSVVSEVSGNTVTIAGNATVAGNIAGAFIKVDANTEPGTIASLTNNTFNTQLDPTHQLKVKSLQNFQQYNLGISGDGEAFYAAHTTKETAMIYVMGIFGDQYNTSKADLTLQNKGITLDEAHQLEKGETAYLLYVDEKKGSYAQGTTLGDNVNVTNLGQNEVAVGLAYSMKVNIAMDENSIYATIIDSPYVDPNAVNRLQPLLDANLTNLMNLQRANALQVDLSRDIEPTAYGEIVTFGKIQQSHSDYKSIETKSNGYNLMMGAGYSFDKAILGAFFETGKTNYDTSSYFEAYKNKDALDFEASGHASYIGGGLLAKAYANENQEGLYFNGFMKGGRAKNQYDSSSFSDNDYRAVGDIHFDESGGYFSVGAGTGYKYKFDEAQIFDTSLFYAYAFLKGNSFWLGGSNIDLNKTKLHTLYLNEDYFYQMSSDLTIHAGVGLQYEFDSKTNGTMDGYQINGVDNKGGTGTFSAGLRMTPFDGDLDKYIEFGVKAYTGRDDGIAGNISVNYNF